MLNCHLGHCAQSELSICIGPGHSIISWLSADVVVGQLEIRQDASSGGSRQTMEWYSEWSGQGCEGDQVMQPLQGTCLGWWLSGGVADAMTWMKRQFGKSLQRSRCHGCWHRIALGTSLSGEPTPILSLELTGCATLHSFDGFSVNPPYLYVVMELCNRGSLTDMLQKNELSYLQRLEMAHDVMCAMAHMHVHGFLHRDMKSLNCFVTDVGDKLALRLGDFGETVTTEAAGSEDPKQVGTIQW